VDNSVLPSTAPYKNVFRIGRTREPHRTIHAPAPLSIKRARHVAPEDVSFRSFDGLEIPAFLFRPVNASVDAPVAAVVYPHGGPTDAYIDDHDPRAQYFLAKGYAWLAVNFRGSTGYGRDFERLNHGTWGVDDTKDCLAAADYLRGLDWVDGDRLAIVGGSYGSYMATLAVTDDPEHRYRCAVAMYGDVDLVTSWAQGDRLGVQDLERMMGLPSAARAAYRAASAVHRLANVEAPILIAHGELDDRVSPRQSEEHVAELREQGRDAECVLLLDQALQRCSSDAHLWSYLGQTKRTLDDSAGAAEAFARAADLMPEDLAQRTESERGCWTYLSDVGLDRLRELDVTDEQIGQMTVDNPRRLFETRDLGGY